MDPANGKTVSVGNLDLPPGYYAERGEAGVYLMDPDGRRVMRFSSDAASAGETGRPKPVAKPGPEEWQELCRSLVIRLSQKSAECEALRARVTELGGRLEAAEADSDQANAIADVLYEFFRTHLREVSARKDERRRRNDPRAG